MENKTPSPYLHLLKEVMIFSVILVAFAMIIYFALPDEFITPALFFLFPFFISVTLITSYVMIRAAGSRFIRFLNIYMITTVAKLFVYIAVMVGYILMHKQDIIPFSITFLLLYLLYTVYEVIWLVRFSKQSRS